MKTCFMMHAVIVSFSLLLFFNELTLISVYGASHFNDRRKEEIGLDICGESSELSSSSGSISSPGYPKEYPVNLNCTIRFSLPKDYRLIVKAKEVDLEPGLFRFLRHSPNDYLQINNGTKYSGHLENKVLYDDSNVTNYSIRFVSDYGNSYGRYRGFHIDYIILKPENKYYLTPDTSRTGKNTAMPNALGYGQSNMASVQETVVRWNKNVYIIGPTIVLIVFISVLAYVRHRRTMNQFQLNIKKTIDELVSYVNSATDPSMPTPGSTQQSYNRTIRGRLIDNSLRYDATPLVAAYHKQPEEISSYKFNSPPAYEQIKHEEKSDIEKK